MPILLAAVLALSTLHASAFNEFHYDPASCKTDAKGHLYIAVGENVLAVPFLKNGVYRSKLCSAVRQASGSGSDGTRRLSW